MTYSSCEKEDRVKHVDSLNANAEPVFSYRAREEVDALLKIYICCPAYDFVAEDNTGMSYG